MGATSGHDCLSWGQLLLAEAALRRLQPEACSSVGICVGVHVEPQGLALAGMPESLIGSDWRSLSNSSQIGLETQGQKIFR